LRNEAEVTQVVRNAKPQIVFHLAALHYIPYCNAHPAEALQVNVVGTQNLLEALRTFQPQKLVIASSAAVYPIRDVANEEESPAGPTDIYGLSKWVNESQLLLFSQQVSTHCAAARLFNVIGPRETNPHVVPEIVRQILANADEIKLGNLKPKRDYIYVTDVVSGLIAIASGNLHSFRIFNVGTGVEHSVDELVDLLQAISGRNINIQVSQDRVRKAERLHLLCDATRMNTECGWQPEHTLESGLTKLWKSEADQRLLT